jgi:hypothetical protein
MIEKTSKLNFVEFISKNLFWYALMVFFNKSFNPTDWWIYQHFWGGVLFVIFEFFIFSTCLIENKEENGN